ncbi:Crp/Fnr family transcriptional regulator [Persicitalea jodogahamensis]|nr:cyclic nucleotide-binding domain-containing protein [Persicitalea jodogahamensis]
MQELVPTLLHYGSLEKACQQAIEKATTPFEYPTGTHLLAPGMVQEQTYFIGEGIAMSHYLTKGKQFVNWFAAAGDFATAVESFHYQRPSREYLTACTPIKGVFIKRGDYDDLLQKYRWRSLSVR